MQYLKSKKNYLFVFLALIISATLFNCSSSNDLTENEENNKIKPILVYGKGDTYKKEWRVVDSLEQNGLTKSALEQVLKIQEKAQSDNNHEQIVKTLMVKAKLQSYVEEGAFVTTMNELNDEAIKAKYPLKPVIHSLIGELYWMFYQNNRWKFYDRSETVNFDNKDITTWDLKKITDASIKHYLLSIKNIDSLKRTPIETYDEIIITKNARDYRPFLYDFLAHRATDYLMNEEPSITKPIYEFAIDDSNYLASFNVFTRLKLVTKDTMSLKFYALKTLQNLTINHLTDTNPQALIDVELKRLQFVKNNAAFQNADTLYFKALTNLYNTYPEVETAAEIIYEIALIYQKRGSAYKFDEPEKYKWDLKTAITLCGNAMEKYKGSYGASLCEKLDHQIRSKSLNVTIEKVNVPNKPFRSLVAYKNLNKVYHKIVKIDFDTYKKWNRNIGYKERFDKINNSKEVKQWVTNTPNDGDLREHKAEIKIDALPLGFYVLLTSTTDSFTHDKEAVALTPIWISNLSFLTRRTKKEEVDFFVMDRTNGNPLKSVKAKLYYEKYNYTIRKYEWKSLGTKITDANGYFKVMPGSDYRNFYADLSLGYDRLNTEDSYYQYQYREDNRVYTKTVFFTDRAIYRPGQTVHFKGIVLQTDNNNNNKIRSNYKSTVTFYDVNHQKVANLKLTTNEYGTFSGSFTTPNNGLNGQMYISDNHGTKYFSVEEYKRPKFEVIFEPVKGTYRLESEVNVVGKAKMFSGAILDGADVNYRVVRNASFSYWCFYRWGHWPSSAQMEIKNGKTKTDDNGEFKVDFIAKPDKSVNKKYAPTYSYTIYADVIDINGETHSTTTYVSVGYKALNLNVSLPNQVHKVKVDTFKLNTTNLNGQFEAASGSIKIWQLKMAAKIYRKPLWSKGDINLITKDEYYKLFPYDEYDDENNQTKWEKKQEVYNVSFNTATKKSFKINDLKKWQSGVYTLEATTKDKYGKEVKEIKFFTVFDEGKEMPNNNLEWFNALKSNGEPGEKAEFLIGSAAKNVKVKYEIEHKGIIVKKEWITLNNEQRKIVIPILEKYRGNFHVHFTFVKYGRDFKNTATITVPYSNKQLDVEFETFRNKLLPGQKEEWKIKIKGKKGEKVAAEMVATLYDASLDAFKPNYWGLYTNAYDYSDRYWNSNTSFSTKGSELVSYDWNYKSLNTKTKVYDQLNWFGYYYGRRYRNYMYKNSVAGGYAEMDMLMESESVAMEESVDEDNFDDRSKESKKVGGKLAANSPSPSKDKNADITTKSSTMSIGADQQKQDLDGAGFEEVKARSNFNETAFFYPHLQTNSKGEVIIKFTIPEALTKWKFIGLAHTKDLKTGMLYEETVTQKDLMVYPNAPRFFRESDQMTFSTKITNLSDKDLEGGAKIFFYDALTMKLISGKLIKSDETVSFNVKQGKSTSVNWQIAIPEGYSAITYKVIAKSGSFTDGEEMAVPVLTNRMLVTESLPLPVRGKGVTNFKFNKLLASGSSSTLKHHKLTLEFTSNPAWYAIQSLPYLMEYPYECAEQTFSRFYANSIASHIANSNPKIKNVFESWKNSTPQAFLSNLEKNQELKALILEETPWVLNSQNESERKKRVGLLFDLNRMDNELGRALKKLQQLQVSNGGWTWFKGMPESRYMTQHIVAGMGHLDHLGVKNIRNDSKTWNMVQKAVRYLDDRIREDYEWLKKHSIDMDKDHLSNTSIQYLYARSYFLSDVEISSRNKEAYNYYHTQAKKYWLGKGRYMQGMIALALHRDGNPKTGIHVEHKIMASLKENAINHDELGMYWKDNVGGYYWYQAPIETQALLIEAFDEVTNDNESVEAMKVWLLKQKQTQDWRTTKATTEACYALLLRGTDLLASDDLVEIKVGNTVVDPKKLDDVKVEAGTGYFKTSWSKTAITPTMGNVTVTKKDDGVAWGSLYWQYFEQLDKITPHETPLKLVKKLFVQRNSDSGPIITLITKETKLKPGDKLKVRIELRVDRDMEYVHMKDMRASGLEPINVFSGYRYQDGLGYYESTKDASTNFFFDYLPKGTYVFEYPLRVNMSGNFSNGITSIQCMYAPEFTSHSEGLRINISSK
ncbi:MAG: alpha-2-macroglobulin family protein [Vicingaceae bacterium]|nr:alpha-2-macroglobulin family protein [Vicingaceae bacterium]